MLKKKPQAGVAETRIIDLLFDLNFLLQAADRVFAPKGCAMTLKIFLDDKGFHCLKRCIPAGSPSKFVLEEAVHLNFFGSNAVISCDETEARNLLLYASHCPSVVASIHKALHSAGIQIHDVTPVESSTCSQALPTPIKR